MPAATKLAIVTPLTVRHTAFGLSKTRRAAISEAPSFGAFEHDPSKQRNDERDRPTQTTAKQTPRPTRIAAMLAAEPTECTPSHKNPHPSHSEDHLRCGAGIARRDAQRAHEHLAHPEHRRQSSQDGHSEYGCPPAEVRLPKAHSTRMPDLEISRELRAATRGGIPPHRSTHRPSPGYPIPQRTAQRSGEGWIR